MLKELLRCFVFLISAQLYLAVPLYRIRLNFCVLHAMIISHTVVWNYRLILTTWDSLTCM